MKTFILSALFAFLCITSYSQRAHPHFGLKAGVNIADLKIENGADLDPRTSFYAGGLAHIHMSKYFALQPEVYFSAQGAKTDNPDVTTSLNYINVPILVQYMTGTGFRLQTGPQVGALISAKRKAGDVSTDIKDDVKTFEFSWSFGLGYLTNKGLGIDARYNIGLNNISEGSNKYQNRVFSVGLFYQFMNN